MHGQTTITFDIPKARERRDEGIERAEMSANNLHANWSDEAYEFLKGYIKINPVFQVEDVTVCLTGNCTCSEIPACMGIGNSQGRKGRIDLAGWI